MQNASTGGALLVVASVGDGMDLSVLQGRGGDGHGSGALVVGFESDKGSGGKKERSDRSFSLPDAGLYRARIYSSGSCVCR
jgi:hypothetical protein